MKIGIFEAEERDKHFFAKVLKKHKLKFIKEPLTSLNAAKYKDLEVVSTFIYSKIDTAVLRTLTKLKFVTTRSTGFDHIDVAECNHNKIKVCNVPFYGENTVAEHAFALMLNLSRNVHKSYIKTIHDDFTIEGLMGFDLKGKTLGVIGTGHIGAHVMKIADGFGMHVIASDVHKNDFLSEVLHFEYVELEYLLKHADIVTLHVPSLPATYHILNKKRIAMMKHGAIVINTARGDLIDTDALFKALKDGKLGGAGLDVVEGEDVIREDHELLINENNPEKLRRLVKDEMLFHLPNVVFTPHIAFFSKEALIRIMQTTADNINSFEKNEKLVNLVVR